MKSAFETDPPVEVYVSVTPYAAARSVLWADMAAHI